MRRETMAVLLVAAAALTAAGCGGGGSAADPVTAAPPSTATTPPATLAETAPETVPPATTQAVTTAGDPATTDGDDPDGLPVVEATADEEVCVPGLVATSIGGTLVNTGGGGRVEVTGWVQVPGGRRVPGLPTVLVMEAGDERSVTVEVAVGVDDVNMPERVEGTPCGLEAGPARVP